MQSVGSPWQQLEHHHWTQSKLSVNLEKLFCIKIAGNTLHLLYITCPVLGWLYLLLIFCVLLSQGSQYMEHCIR